MKKITLFFSLLLTSYFAFSQGINLSGSYYLQKFDSLGFDTVRNGLPAGWTVRTAAYATYLGDDGTYPHFQPLKTWWATSTGQFRNSASADVFPNAASGTHTAQDNATNRCLSVRQDAQSNTNFPNSDSGAAFVLEIANTTGFTNFTLQFKLQSLDSGDAITDTITHTEHWSVDYGIGAIPATFTLATLTGTTTTGGCSDSGTGTFSNNTVNANFGTGLDNQAGPVWIRILTRQYSTSCTSGLKPTTGIDDYYLSYTNASASVASVAVETIDLHVVGAATSSQMNLAFVARESGIYDVSLFDLTGRQVYKQSINCSNGVQRATIDGFNLSSGMYIVKVANGNHFGVTKAILQ